MSRNRFVDAPVKVLVPDVPVKSTEPTPPSARETADAILMKMLHPFNIFDLTREVRECLFERLGFAALVEDMIGATVEPLVVRKTDELFREHLNDYYHNPRPGY